MTVSLEADDARAVAEMLVLMGRAIPLQRWVDSFVTRAENASLEGLF